MDKALPVKGAADYLGIHVNTLKRLPPEQLPYFRVAKRGDRRYRLSDLEAYILRHLVRGEDE